jgi:hypothetical protein
MVKVRFKRVFNLSRHECVGVILENAQAGAGAEVDPLAAIFGAGIFGGVFDFSSTGGLVFGDG